MKLLVIGIDGGTADIFDSFDMPFWKSLRRRDVTFDVTEDLNQRGWARMLSGKGAEDTGALYVRPLNDQSLKFDLTYNYEMLSQTQGFEPIWRLAENAGARVGMMNVPTTSPAQAVNGFYISGGGGGIFQGGLPENSVYPESERQFLRDHGYIFDTRLGAERFDKAENLCAHIIEMMTARTKAFQNLAQRHEIDFGFVAYRATTVLFYMAMSEISHMMRLQPDDPRRNSWTSPWLNLINNHMKALDDTLARLFDTLQPKHHIIASDHSMVPWTHNVDFNGFLAETGLARRPVSARAFMRNSARAALRPKFRQQLRQVPLGQVGKAFTTDNATMASGPRAFSGTYVYGIYVNDNSRFGGPVPEEDVSTETEAIVDSFNWAALRNGVDMRAVPYRQRFDGAPKQAIMPDVTILQSGHAFPTSTVGPWYAPNPNFAPVRSVKGLGGMHSGQKGCHPILMADPELAALHDTPSAPDLRLVHALTARLFER